MVLIWERLGRFVALVLYSLFTDMITYADLGILWDTVESPRLLGCSRQLSRSCRW